MIDLGTAYEYNESMLTPNSGELMRKVLAGQQLNLQNSAEPSPWLQALGGVDSLMQWTRDQLLLYPELHQVFAGYLEEIRTRKVGPQGQAISIETAMAILAQYDHPSHAKCTLNDYIFGVDGAYYTLMRMFRALPWEGITPDEQVVFGQVLAKDPSNTGWRGYTTAQSRDPDFLRIFRLNGACHYPGQVPMVMGARHALNKYRGIYGGAPEHLWEYTKYLDGVLTKSLKGSPVVSYHSELDTAAQVETFTRVNAGKAFYGVGCDYKAMDVWHSYELARDSVSFYAQHVLGASEDELIDIVKALHTFFVLPVLALDGHVYKPSNGYWSTLSGIGPTNGSECCTNTIIQCVAYTMAKNKLGYAPDWLLKVMGDDSASFFAGETPGNVMHFAEVYVDCFMEVSENVGLCVNREKQEMSADGLWFCKRYFPLRPIMGLKRVDVTTTHDGVRHWLETRGVCSQSQQGGVKSGGCTTRQVVYPFYPVERVINSLIYPERPVIGRRYAFPRLQLSAEELRSAFGVLANGWGDKRTKPLAVRMAQMIPKGVLGDDIIRQASGMLNDRRFNTWRAKVYGADATVSSIDEVLCIFVNR